MKFDKAFEILIGHEGGYTNNPNDNGNWTGGAKGKGTLKGTKYGIAANSYPNLDIKNLTLAEAKAIYKRDYWDKVRCDELPEKVRFQIFDMAVNAGTNRAIKILQQSLGFPTREVDGILGKNTLAKIQAADGDSLVLLYSANRIEFYTSLGTFGTFGKGWMRRVASSIKTAVNN